MKRFSLSFLFILELFFCFVWPFVDGRQSMEGHQIGLDLRGGYNLPVHGSAVKKKAYFSYLASVTVGMGH